MTKYADAVKPVVDDAVKWVGQSTRCWMDSYARLVDGAATGTLTSESAVRDVSALAATGARDMARAWTTCLSLGTALLNIDLTAAGEAGSTAAGGVGDRGAPKKAAAKAPAKKTAAKKTAAKKTAAKKTAAKKRAAKKRGGSRR